ncbi:hypothetical protein Nepgr_027031 [Nepenthes gracilis]|uniref:Uncharacterized protein n=1 Tax=Nepenthes gracilis TaxID=150966 RepID=A0AAD3T8A4_NEPGR|nr:hypothetical protein Nepgr_027031 [Nepenthes gracilis]
MRVQCISTRIPAAGLLSPRGCEPFPSVRRRGWRWRHFDAGILRSDLEAHDYNLAYYSLSSTLRIDLIYLISGHLKLYG